MDWDGPCLPTSALACVQVIGLTASISILSLALHPFANNHTLLQGLVAWHGTLIYYLQRGSDTCWWWWHHCKSGIWSHSLVSFLSAGLYGSRARAEFSNLGYKFVFAHTLVRKGICGNAAFQVPVLNLFLTTHELTLLQYVHLQRAILRTGHVVLFTNQS